MDRLVPCLEACQCFGFVPSPHAAGDDAWRSTLGAQRVAEMIAAIGAVGKHLAKIAGQSIGTGLAVVDIGRCDGDLLNKGRIGVGAQMGFEAMNRSSTLMFDPMAVVIILTGRGDDRRIDKRAGLHLDRFGLELAGDLTAQGLVQTMGHKGFSKTHESRSLRPNQFRLREFVARLKRTQKQDRE